MNKKWTAMAIAFFLSFSGIAFAEEPAVSDEESTESAESIDTVETLGAKIKTLNQEKTRIKKEFARERDLLNRKLSTLILETLRSGDKAVKELKQKERAEILRARETLQEAYKARKDALTEEIKSLIEGFLNAKREAE